MPFTVFFVRVVLVLFMAVLWTQSAFVATLAVWAVLAGIVVFVFEAIGLLGWLLGFLGSPLPHNRKG